MVLPQVAFYACLIAGVVAVPVFPPDPRGGGGGASDSASAETSVWGVAASLTCCLGSPSRDERAVGWFDDAIPHVCCPGGGSKEERLFAAVVQTSGAAVALTNRFVPACNAGPTMPLFRADQWCRRRGPPLAAPSLPPATAARPFLPSLAGSTPPPRP